MHGLPAKDIYTTLRERWVGFPSPQDKSFGAHYTIQNKAESGVPQKLLEEVRQRFGGSKGEVDGLTLWRYDRGYWRHVREFAFRVSAATEP